MKFLIWVSMFFITSLVTVLINYAGITLGGIPTMLLYLFMCFIASILCKKWDEHKSTKSARNSARQKGITAIEYVSKRIDPKILRHCEIVRGSKDKLQLLLNKYEREERITREESTILFAEYKSPQQTEFTQPKKVVNPAPATPRVDANQSDDDLTPENVLRSIMAFQANETVRTMKANAESQPNNENDADFGLVPEKPIFTLAPMLVDGEKEYLNKLYTADGEKITYTRRGSTGVPGINGMIDIYDTHLPSGQFYKTIYIDMYGAKTSQSAPKGFSFSANAKAPEPAPVHHVDIEENHTSTSNAKKTCPKCNHEVRGNSEYCHFCGSKIGAGTSMPVKVTAVESHREDAPVIPVVSNGNANKEKRVFCKKCGSVVDSKTKKCTGCGKQYFKLTFKPIQCVFLAILLLLSVYLGTYFAVRSQAKQRNWQRAEQLLFIPTFTELHDPKLITYIHAGKLLESEEYAAAKAKFEDLGTYINSETLVNEAKFLLGTYYLYERGLYGMAIDIFEELADIDYPGASEMYAEAISRENLLFH